MSEKKSPEAGTDPLGIQPPPKGAQLGPPGKHLEPLVSPPPEEEIEDWRMNREWCLNQALDIVKSLKFEVKDVPAFLDAAYRKIVELADDARQGKKA